MKTFLTLLCSVLLFTSCSHVAEKEVFKTHFKKDKFETQREYLDALGLRDFDNSRDHSVYAYPLTKAYPSTFKDFLQQHPKIKQFVEMDDVIGRCFYLKIEARDLGRDEVDLVKWAVSFGQQGDSQALDFVRIPDVSPRRSVKRRMTQRGRETWWINETFVCSEKELSLESSFRLKIQKLHTPQDEAYKLNWYVL